MCCWWKIFITDTTTNNIRQPNCTGEMKNRGLKMERFKHNCKLLLNSYCMYIGQYIMERDDAGRRIWKLVHTEWIERMREYNARAKKWKMTQKNCFVGYFGAFGLHCFRYKVKAKAVSLGYCEFLLWMRNAHCTLYCKKYFKYFVSQLVSWASACVSSYVRMLFFCCCCYHVWFIHHFTRSPSKQNANSFSAHVYSSIELKMNELIERHLCKSTIFPHFQKCARLLNPCTHVALVVFSNN